jgi:hypothetical protein
MSLKDRVWSPKIYTYCNNLCLLYSLYMSVLNYGFDLCCDFLGPTVSSVFSLQWQYNSPNISTKHYSCKRGDNFFAKGLLIRRTIIHNKVHKVFSIKQQNTK